MSIIVYKKKKPSLIWDYIFICVSRFCIFMKYVVILVFQNISISVHQSFCSIQITIILYEFMRKSCLVEVEQVLLNVRDLFVYFSFSFGQIWSLQIYVLGILYGTWSVRIMSLKPCLQREGRPSSCKMIACELFRSYSSVRLSFLKVWKCKHTGLLQLK